MYISSNLQVGLGYAYWNLACGSDHSRQRVLSSCPWAYEKSLLVLAHVELSENPSVIDLDWCEFYIHIHGLPVGKMTKEVATWIGNKIGRFIETDTDENDTAWGSSIRIRAAIDVIKPLRRTLKIHTVLGDDQLVTFTYERLSNFCYLCGCLDTYRDHASLDFGMTLRIQEKIPLLVHGSEPPPSISRRRNPTLHHPLPKRPTFLSKSNSQSSQSPHSKPGQAIFDNFHQSTHSDNPPFNPPPTVHIHKQTTPHPLPVHVNDLNLPPSTTNDHIPYQPPSSLASPPPGFSQPLQTNKPIARPDDHPLNPQFHSHISSPHTKKPSSSKKSVTKPKIMLPQKRGLLDEGSDDSDLPMQVRINDGQDWWRYTGFYGEPDTSNREVSWKLLLSLKARSHRPWICGGDFNEILSQHEKAGGPPRPNWQIRNFRRALEDCGLSDLDFQGNAFTWTNRQQPPHLVKLRLDRAVASSSWTRMFPNATVTHLPTHCSDHLPFWSSSLNSRALQERDLVPLDLNRPGFNRRIVKRLLESPGTMV
ncbi:UNVERIFIED_CONTAM: hypothetical protein Slati_0455800 [Sesamum latifolium]|uniref:Endonuclease/exonuclease/phosphatase n=1 Tax=Sesamum latifolium TaxID=2727402 RepID=A0AAW2XWX0_9LAMI